MKKFPLLVFGLVTVVLFLLSIDNKPASAIVCPDPDEPCEPTPPPTSTPSPLPTNTPAPGGIPLPDADSDGIPDIQDNCPAHANPGQSDYPDGDGLGNVCDSDDDNDNVPDSIDYCSLNAGPVETDGCPAYDHGSMTIPCTHAFSTFTDPNGEVWTGLGLIRIPITVHYDLFYSYEGIRFNVSNIELHLDQITDEEFVTPINGTPSNIIFDIVDPRNFSAAATEYYVLKPGYTRISTQGTVSLALAFWNEATVNHSIYCDFPFSPNLHAHKQSGLSLYQSTGLMNLVSVANNNAWDEIIEYQPTKAYSGQWITGDWNGDGFKTPGVHDGGAFYFTNDLGVTDNWQAIWLGFADKPLVAGRFDLYAYNDCIGVINDSIQPATGDTRFALNYWCDMETAPGAGDLLTQFLAAPLPDSQGFSGTHQFAAGDWDGDGVDTMAVRRGNTVTFTNVHPSTGPAQYANSQYWGAPAGVSGEGMFVPGDWDDDGVDSWGVLYDDSQFYYRNEITWNSGTYQQKTLSISLDPYHSLSAWGGK